MPPSVRVLQRSEGGRWLSLQGLPEACHRRAMGFSRQTGTRLGVTFAAGFEVFKLNLL